MQNKSLQERQQVGSGTNGYGDAANNEKVAKIMKVCWKY